MGTAVVSKHSVRLSSEQRQCLFDLVHNGSAPAKKLARARVLLLSDRDHPDGQRTDEYIAKALHLHLNTVKRIRKRFVLEGEQPALNRKLRPAPPPKIDGRIEAHLVATCCSPPPEGRERWTLTLLVNELERKGLVTVCRETVRRALKKIRSSLGVRTAGAFRRRMPPVS